MYVERFLEKEIYTYLTKREIIAVVGPRQCGKTTMLRHIYDGLKKAVFLDFEDRDLLDLFTQDVKSFVELHVKNQDFLFIDEFQYAKEGGKNLKYIYDNYDVKIFISGSSVSELSIHGLQYLVGRVFVFELFQFSFEEYLSFKQPALYKIYLQKKLSAPIIKRITPFFNEFCIFGGYPRVVLATTSEEKEIVLKNIYNTYFLKEIREILNLPDDHKLSKLIHLLALQAGSMINYAELSGITGFKYADLLNNLNVLEKTFICLRSQPFYKNKRTELVKTPKIFFFDCGLRNFIIKNFQPIKNRVDKGQLYENFVASEINKTGLTVRYWRTKSKAEVDFVVEINDEMVPIEIKSDLRMPKLTKSLMSFIDKYKQKNSIVLSETLFVRRKNILFKPIFTIRNILKTFMKKRP